MLFRQTFARALAHNKCRCYRTSTWATSQNKAQEEQRGEEEEEEDQVKVDKAKELMLMFSNQAMSVIPFNEPFDLSLDSLSSKHVAMSFPMTDKLIGNPFRKSLHGGAIATVMDVCSGTTALVNRVLNDDKHDVSLEYMVHCFPYLGTVDLNVHYVAPGFGERYTVRAEIVGGPRKKIATVQCTLHNDHRRLIAQSLATFSVDIPPFSKEIDRQA
jgi:acyl-coenzyme A thioesterase PaaI-like protein